MMTFVFATCDRHRALGFIRRLLPSVQIEDTPESAGPVLDFVEMDIIRIGDPAFHGGTVYASKGTPEQINEAIEALKRLQSLSDAARAAREHDLTIPGERP
jgi:hypothetical protein